MTRDTADMFDPPYRGRFGENEERQSRPGQGPRVTGASDLHDFTLELRQDRPNSIMVTDPAGPGKPWIPLSKSLIEYVHGASGTVIVTMPEWLARDKGLIW